MPDRPIPDPFYRGKVRDLYPVDETSMIIVASDRISAFDVVFAEPVPGKGRILTHVSSNWFSALRRSGFEERHKIFDHIIETDIRKFPEPYRNHEPFRGRAVHVKRTKRIDFECVVRGYLAGSGFKEYVKTGEVCGHTLPKGLQMASRLPAPIFTPATKAPEGEHDENISVSQMASVLGTELTERLERISIDIFKFAEALLEIEGILLCDTKFEFGMIGDDLYLIDEVLTPDSSRYWERKTWRPGINPPGYDKQYIRDYVEGLGWNKTPPPPQLPSEVIHKTIDLYEEIETKITRILHA
jgi:phosphoribosylaminoimidazole-succinocarboxamide synthase